MFTEKEQQSFRCIIEDLFCHMTAVSLSCSSPCIQIWQMLNHYCIYSNASQCKVIFSLRDLPEFKMCFNCLNIDKNTDTAVLQFYVQHISRCGKFTYGQSYLKDTIEYSSGSDITFADRCKSLTDIFRIIQFIYNHPALAYYYAIYGLVDKDISTVSTLKALYVKWRDRIRYNIRKKNNE